VSDYPVLPGAEPFYVAGSKVGILLCHGYTGSPQSMRYLAEYLAEHGGFSVSLPRLPGHGTALEDMARTSAVDWLGAVRAALAELEQRCTSVFVVGLSMGGTLALHVAATRPDVVRGAVLINTPLSLDNPDFAAIAFSDEAPEYLPAIGSDIKRADVGELSYPGAPVATAKHLYALIATARELAPRLSCPLLVFTSREDHVVPPANGPYLLEHAGSSDKRLVMLEDSYHVATLDNDRERIACETLEFIRSRCASAVGAAAVG
jgi:carboxylesterase